MVDSSEKNYQSTNMNIFSVLRKWVHVKLAEYPYCPGVKMCWHVEKQLINVGLNWIIIEGIKGVKITAEVWKPLTDFIIMVILQKQNVSQNKIYCKHHLKITFLKTDIKEQI